MSLVQIAIVILRNVIYVFDVDRICGSNEHIAQVNPYVSFRGFHSSRSEDSPRKQLSNVTAYHSAPDKLYELIPPCSNICVIDCVEIIAKQFAIARGSLYPFLEKIYFAVYISHVRNDLYC